MHSNQLVLSGAVNWVHPAWNRGFYPDDLPEDWLLPYYNTQFQAVYLPVHAWQEVSEATWKQWLEDTHSGFYFVLQAESGTTAKPASERVLLATPEWEAAHVWWLDEAPDLRALAQRMAQQAARGEPMFVFSRSGDLALLQQVDALKQVMGY